MMRQKRCKLKEKNYKPLSNYDILRMISKLKIPHFDGVYMRDTLSRKTGPKKQECWILNHANSNANGTHWTALAKNYNIAFYFDSFGKLPPPFEVIDYLGDKIHLYYNAEKYQSYGTNICGHLCLRFLHDFWKQQKKV